jgi:hypothetical protein
MLLHAYPGAIDAKQVEEHANDLNLEGTRSLLLLLPAMLHALQKMQPFCWWPFSDVFPTFAASYWKLSMFCLCSSTNARIAPQLH